MQNLNIINLEGLLKDAALDFNRTKNGINKLNPDKLPEKEAL